MVKRLINSFASGCTWGSHVFWTFPIQGSGYGWYCSSPWRRSRNAYAEDLGQRHAGIPNALAGKAFTCYNEYLPGTTRLRCKSCTMALFVIGDQLGSWNPMEKKEAYLYDITYSTKLRLVSTHLRDNMVVRAENMVQRPPTMPWSMRLTQFWSISSYNIDRFRSQCSGTSQLLPYGWPLCEVFG